jgi:hypothetical protein
MHIQTVRIPALIALSKLVTKVNRMCATPCWRYQTTVTIFGNVIIVAVSLNTATVWQYRPESKFTLRIYFGIFTFSSRKKNSYLSASPHFTTFIAQQPRQLSYLFDRCPWTVLSTILLQISPSHDHPWRQELEKEDSLSATNSPHIITASVR